MNDLERMVLELIGEDTSAPDVFTDDSAGMAQIRDSLNDAIEEISMLTGTQTRTYLVPLRPNRSFYRVVSTRDKLCWVNAVWLTGIKRKLRQVDFIWLNAWNPRWMENSGSPERYVVVGGDMLCVHPAPASNANALEITATVVPDRYQEDTDRLKLREAFRWAAVHYAVGEFWASRGDAKQAGEHMQAYLSRLGMQKLYPEAYERRWQFNTTKAGTA